MKNQKEIIEGLRKFKPTEQGDWTGFVELLDELWETKNPQKAYKTLFEILVQYDDDYMECQWAIVHGMERFGGYEEDLIASLSKHPVDLTLTMVIRLINSGKKKIGGKKIEALLNEILDRTDLNEDIRELTHACKSKLKKD